MNRESVHCTERVHAQVIYTEVTLRHGLDLSPAYYDAGNPPTSSKVMHHSGSKYALTINF